MTTTGRTKLATLAGANKLRGAVCVTDAGGITHRYDSAAEAEAAWGGSVSRLEHKRGAFFEVPAPALRDTTSSKRKRSRSDDENT
jgi:hypothetical protein